MSQDFDASVVTELAFTLLLSLNATCAASPGCKPWCALVFIGKSSEFMELSCGWSLRSQTPLVGRRKKPCNSTTAPKTRNSQLALRACPATTGANVFKFAYPRTGKSQSGTKSQFGTTRFFLRFLHQHPDPLRSTEVLP